MRAIANISIAGNRQAARISAMSIAAAFIAGALWTLMPTFATQADAGTGARESAQRSGRMLIPSGVPEHVGGEIDHAIARQQHGAELAQSDEERQDGERATPGKTVDAIFRVEPHSRQRGDRVMT